jgi:predicted O-linked N-acetylglucosamine transferase (SPINDLY family)
VQVSWLGYPNTTGLAAMDHRLTDAWADPPGTTETLHTEELVRLPGGFLCFRPAAETPPVPALPSSLGAPFSFGSFNNMAKVSQMTVEMWAQVLRAVPGSRLALKNKALSEPEARRRIQDRFAALGIAPQRIWMGGAIESLASHLEAYSQVDVALDTYPYHGTTTTCEALWMGVPVVSRLGRAHLSRVGLSLLEAAGLGHLAVDSAEAYVRTAAALAQDRGRLAQLRGGLRKTLSRSRLMDEQRFVKELEDAYRAMWRRWCAAEVVRKGEFRK